MIGPWLMGLVSDWLGITAGFSLVLVYFIVVLGSLLVLSKIQGLSKNP